MRQTKISYEEEQLEIMCAKVGLPDEAVYEKSREHWDRIAKPLSGLGKLEEMISQIAGIKKQEAVTLSRKAVVVFCSDNGVVAEGVSQTGSHVTAIVAENMARGTASINRMAALAGAEVLVVDMGVASDLQEQGIRNCKLAYGTRNFSQEPAMTRQQAVEGILTGICLAGELKDAGYDILATGEMGIGNTTTSSAVASVLLNVPVWEVTGKGAGLSNSGLLKKMSVIEQGISLHCPDVSDPLEVLGTLGGFDLAGLCGFFLGGAVYKIPIVLDGAISQTAALLAERICPAARAYMLPSHMGKEPVCRLLMRELKLEPVIRADLALGEGTGAVLLFPMLDMALEVYKEYATFDDVQIEAYEKFAE